MPSIALSLSVDVWPLRQVFRIAHGQRTEAHVVQVGLSEDGVTGRGECVPYARYGETPESVCAQIEALRPALAAGMDRIGLQDMLPAGAARNALDCAFWDLEARKSGVPVWQLAGLPEPRPLLSAYTIALDTPEAMSAAALAASVYPLLKVKIGGPGDLDRIAAVANARPDARLIVDANEGMGAYDLKGLLADARALRIELIEQPFKAGAETALSRLAAPVALCADESFHVAADVEKVVTAYDAVNVKLDKAGGLTEAINAVREAQAAGLKIMVGCMVGSSLGAAPAALLAALADWVDLDGPLLLARDHDPGLAWDGAMMQPAPEGLWGH